VIKDLTHSIRSAGFIGMAVLAPLLLIGLVYFAFGGIFRGASGGSMIDAGVVNADQLSQDISTDHSLGDELDSLFSRWGADSWITPGDYEDETSVRAAMERGDIKVGVIVPQDFTVQFLAGKGDHPIQIIGDPVQLAAAQTVQNLIIGMLDDVLGSHIALQAIADRYQENGLQTGPTQIQELVADYKRWQAEFQREFFRHSSNAALVMVAPHSPKKAGSTVEDMVGILMAGQMVFFAFFGGAFSMMSILREEEEGTLGRLFTMPVGRSTILAGKFGAVYLAVLLQGVVLIVVSHYAFGINWGNPLEVLMLLIGQVAAAVGLGVLLISFIKTSQQGGPVLGGVLTVLGMLGGLFTSGFSMPDSFTKLALITPQGWVIKAWRIVMNGQPLREVVIPITVLIVIGTVLFVSGAVRFQKRYA
jgi:ABC-type transport system involved in multi-copper enzyme maturation permease subunit